MTKIKYYEFIGEKPVYNIEMKSKYHNYLVNGVVSKNSHSMAYSALSYATAYLKTNFPLEYMTALLNANSADLDKINLYIDECYRLGLNINPPDINKSGDYFEHDKEKNAITFGFKGIKGVGDSNIEAIVAERNNGNFESLKDLLNRIPSLNKTVISNLIKCGALDTIEKSPYKYLPVLEYSSKAKAKADYKKGDISFYDCLVKTYVENILKDNDTYKKIDLEIKNIKGTKKEDKEKKAELKNKLNDFITYGIKAFESDSSHKKPDPIIIKENQIELLGFPISCNPKKEIIALSPYIDSDKVVDIKNSKDYVNLFTFLGRVKSVKKTKNGSYFAVLTDDTEEITTFIKKDTYNLLEDKITQPNNYFRFYGFLNKSYNPEKYPDSFKIEGIRYFNTTQDSEIILKSESSKESLTEFLTDVKESAIINCDNINYKLIILHDGTRYTTKIDYWVEDIKSIGSLMIKYGMVVLNE